MSDFAELRNVAIYLSGGHVIRLLLTEEETAQLNHCWDESYTMSGHVTGTLDAESGVRLKLDLRSILAVVYEDAQRIIERTQLLYEMQEHAS